MTPHWRDDAACASPDVDPEWFFDQNDPRRALAVCRRCPVTAECAREALTHDVYGVWGGTLLEHRKRIAERVKR